MNKVLICFFLCFFLLFTFGCKENIPAAQGVSSYVEEGVSIEDKGEYFDVVLDYTTGLNRRQIGAAFARGILNVVPNYEYLVDLYIAESLANYQYVYAFYRIDDMKLQMNKEYMEEIEGMASVFSGGKTNGWKDGKLSIDELYLFNLFPDVIRGTQCSIVSVFGDRSSTSTNIVGRNLEWFGGTINQLPKIQAIIRIKNENKKICSIGYMGFIGVITGINDSGIFTGILDSQSGFAFSAEGKDSYPLELRYALENTDSLYDAAEYMKDPMKHFSVNHLIVFADAKKSIVLENNFSGRSTIQDGRVNRRIRESNSKLNQNIEWEFDNAIGCVNSFMLNGNYDNHTNTELNTTRWKSIREQLLDKGDTVTPEQMKEIMSFKHGSSPGLFSESGDLYNRMTLQMMVFQPANFKLEVFFRSKDIRENPDHPVFREIKIFND